MFEQAAASTGSYEKSYQPVLKKEGFSNARAVFEGRGGDQSDEHSAAQTRVDVRGNLSAARAVFEGGAASSGSSSSSSSASRVEVRGNLSAARAVFEGGHQSGTSSEPPARRGVPRKLNANTEKCSVCDKTVYFADKLTADEKIYHKVRAASPNHPEHVDFVVPHPRHLTHPHRRASAACTAMPRSSSATLPPSKVNSTASRTLSNSLP